MAVIEREISRETLVGITGYSLKTDIGELSCVFVGIFLSIQPVKEVVVFVVEEIGLIIEMKCRKGSHGSELKRRQMLRLQSGIIRLRDETVIERKIGESLGIRQLEAETLMGYIQQGKSWRKGFDDIFFLPVFKIVAETGIQYEA